MLPMDQLGKLVSQHAWPGLMATCRSVAKQVADIFQDRCRGLR